MRSTLVCVVRPPKAEHTVLAEGLRILARATRMVFARVYQRREDEVRVKRSVCASLGLLSRHYSGCRADATAAARGWRERLVEQRAYLRSRLAVLEATRERDAKTAARRRRNAVATRRARVDKELLGPPRHCFGRRKLLRQGCLDAWRARRDGNALFAGETGRVGGNTVARWDCESSRLALRLPGGLPPVALDGVCFRDQATKDLKACMKARTPVTWRVKLLSRGRVGAGTYRVALQTRPAGTKPRVRCLEDERSPSHGARRSQCASSVRAASSSGVCGAVHLRARRRSPLFNARAITCAR